MLVGLSFAKDSEVATNPFIPNVEKLSNIL